MTIKISARLFPQAIPTIRAHLTAALGRAADVSADILDENLSLHGVSGAQWKNLPRRSSAENEMPQEQFGNLRGAIKFYQDNGRWYVGFSGLDEQYLKHIEFASPADGGRAPLSTTMTSEITWDQMARAIDQGPKL